MPFCSQCQIHCPSDYQMRQHLSGRKHADAMRGGGGEIKGICFAYKNKGYCPMGYRCSYDHISTTTRDSSFVGLGRNKSVSKVRSGTCPPGFCYLWWNNGYCSKGGLCTYKHYQPEDSDEDSAFEDSFISPIAPKIKALEKTTVVTPSSRKRSSESNDPSCTISAEFLLFKKEKVRELKSPVTLKEQQSPVKALKLAPIFCKVISKSTQGGEKESPSKASKLAPIFSKPIKKKAGKTSRFPEKYRNLFYRKKGINLYIKDGLVVWEFSYNLAIIDAIKEHIKGRAWNPSIGVKGCWTNPIESLPDAIDLYEHLGREAPSDLKKRAEKVKRQFGGASPSDSIKVTVEIFVDKLKRSSENVIDEDLSSIGSLSVKFLYDAFIVEALKELAPSQRTYDPSKKIWKVELLALTDLIESLSLKGFKAAYQLEKLSHLVNDMNHLMYNSNESMNPLSPSSVEQSFGESKDLILLEDSDDETEHISSKVKKEEIALKDTALNEKERALKLGRRLSAVIDIVSKANGNERSINLLSLDCGTSKRSRISSSRYRNSWMDSLDGLSLFTRKYFQTPKHNIPSDCDCGRPEIMNQGIHNCRYFGTFQCLCGNTWTSAYCWKGEMQACRSCETEILPTKKRPLERGIGGGGDGSEHDSSRCGRCRALGYPCNY